jgi:hypothetical protein
MHCAVIWDDMPMLAFPATPVKTEAIKRTMKSKKTLQTVKH